MSPSFNFKKAIYVILSATLFIAACSRDGVVYKDYELTADDTGFNTDFGAMQFVNEDVESMVNIAAQNQNPNFKGCAPVVTHDTGSKLLVIDFGGECEETASKIKRKGRIIVNYTRGFFDSGSVHTIRFDDYYYNGKRMTGFKTIENRGYNTDSLIYFSIVVSDTMHLGGNDGYITWSSENTRTWISGFNSNSTIADDVFLVSGNGSLKRANDAYCDFNILSPLQVSWDCQWVQSGMLQLIPRNGNARTLDFGGGDCDNKGTLELAGKMFDVVL